MNALYLHYAFFKRVTEGLDDYIKKEIEYDDNLIFNLSGFNNIGNYYSLKSFKDKYKFSEGLNENFDTFITECLLNISKNNDYQKLYFLYALISSHVLDKYLLDYIESIEGKNLSKEKLYKMIDFSIASIDKVDISNNNLYKMFEESFTYYDYMDDLIHEPCIMTLKFMASKEYFKKCYKKKKKFLKSFTKRNIFFLNHKIINVLFRSKKNTNDFIMKDNRKIDITLISNETLQKAYNEVKNIINEVNDYLFNFNEKGVRKIFNIPKDKKI